MRDIEKYNEELQSRILKLESELKESVSEVLRLNLSNTELLKRDVSKSEQIETFKDTVRKYKDIKYPHDNKPSIKSYTSGKVKSSKTKPQKFKNRSKSIRGIVRRKDKYNLSDIEVSFLISIEHKKVISQLN